MIPRHIPDEMRTGRVTVDTYPSHWPVSRALFCVISLTRQEREDQLIRAGWALSSGYVFTSVSAPAMSPRLGPPGVSVA